MSNLYINQEYLDELISVFDKYCPNAVVCAYGSRVDGDAHEGSDLDLAIKNLDDCGIYLFELKDILQESNIPILVDIVEFEQIPDSFKNEIRKKYVQIYPKNNL